MFSFNSGSLLHPYLFRIKVPPYKEGWVFPIGYFCADQMPLLANLPRRLFGHSYYVLLRPVDAKGIHHVALQSKTFDPITSSVSLSI